ncbi:MAG: NAD-dependent epimerase/dehydratase family protein [Actinomycetota bacterium]
MNGKAFVTGGTGVVGRPILARLLEDGRPVAALARSEDSARVVAAVGADPVRGDLLDVDALAAGMRGCETVFHAAGLNVFCSPAPSMLFRVNVGGSRAVLAAAARAAVRRIVYTSSAATLGEERGTVGRENTPHRGWFLSAYERSKYEAERDVLADAERHGLEVVCVNPSSVQGPGRTGGTAKLLLAYLNGRLKVIVDTRLSFVDMADCTEGHVLAEEKGQPGQRYVLNGATLSVGQALDLLARISGVGERVRRLPAPAALAAAAAIEAVFRLRGRRAPLCREMVRTLLHGHAYDGSRASRELGLRYTSAEETLRRTCEWYRERGLITRPLPGAR